MSYYSYTAVPNTPHPDTSMPGEEKSQKQWLRASEMVVDIGSADTLLLGVKYDVPRFADLESPTELEIPDDPEIPYELELRELKDKGSDSYGPNSWSYKELMSINGNLELQTSVSAPGEDQDDNSSMDVCVDLDHQEESVEAISSATSRTSSTHLVNEAHLSQAQVRGRVYTEKLTALSAEVDFKGSVTGPQHAESNGILKCLTFILHLLGLRT